MQRICPRQTAYTPATSIEPSSFTGADDLMNFINKRMTWETAQASAFSESFFKLTAVFCPGH
ncbi:MAG: hypothetical protein ACLSA6_18010 [Holdemania massiliensis]